MNRIERIARKVVGAEYTQGWYSTTGRIVIWTRIVAQTEMITLFGLKGMVERATKVNQSTVDILGKKVQNSYENVLSYRGKPGVIVFMEISASRDEMKGLDEGRPKVN